MITMDLSTAISVTGLICVVLFNVYEFRKVGGEIEKIGRDIHKSHEGLVKALNSMQEQMHRDHREMRKEIERGHQEMRKEIERGHQEMRKAIHKDHMEIVNALKSS